MGVGVWTLLEKSDYISLLSSKTYAASAYILVLAGAIVMVTGVLGCCATFKEQRRLLRVVRDHVRVEIIEAAQRTHLNILKCVTQKCFLLSYLDTMKAKSGTLLHIYAYFFLIYYSFQSHPPLPIG